jgi:hypothetical protein
VSGETVLTRENGVLLRNVQVAVAHITYQDANGKVYRLKEEKQVFIDGRVRERNLSGSVSEKMKPGEDPRDAIARGIQEELGINTSIDSSNMRTEITQMFSQSYPNLTTKFTSFTFDVQLTAEQFVPDGYREVQADKTTFFVWEEMS